MKKKFRTMIAILLSLVCLPMGGTVFAKEETTAKDWDYWASLDDYSVYCEYCKTYGYEIQEELPSRWELPNYTALHYGNSDSTLEYAQFSFIFDDSIFFPNEKYYDVRYDMSYFGFPEEWKEWHKMEDTVDGDDWFSNSIDIYNFGGAVTIQFSPTEYTENLADNVINAYRVVLTVQNSQFCEEYPVIYSYIEKNVVYDSETSFDSGDVNADGQIALLDAAAINRTSLGTYTLAWDIEKNAG